MEKMIVRGGRPLKGEVVCSGSKNAALPILAATILADGPCALGSIPDLKDIEVMQAILSHLGVKVERTPEGRVITEVVDESACMAPYELVSTMRGSICTLGPLLARRGRAKVSLPGGCVIGDRPIDLHLKGLQAMGAKIAMEHGYVCAEAERLHGADIYLGGGAGPSVLGTSNVMMAACLAHGKTVIEHAACEPEVEDVARFLKAMGAHIQGIGTHRLVIHGVRRLHGCPYDIIPDRIEAGTWMAAAAITRGEILIHNIRLDHLYAVVDKLKEAGVSILDRNGSVLASMDGRPNEVEIASLPYPGFPTDMQAQVMALLTLSDGASIITEKIYPDRFMHVPELCRLGARIKRVGDTAVVIGQKRLQGAPVMASDLRASAALVIAGLAAQGETEVRRIYHLDRGYEHLERKLKVLGADVRRAEETSEPAAPVVLAASPARPAVEAAPAPAHVG